VKTYHIRGWIGLRQVFDDDITAEVEHLADELECESKVAAKRIARGYAVRHPDVVIQLRCEEIISY
jgi:hypothetical protein